MIIIVYENIELFDMKRSKCKKNMTMKRKPFESNFLSKTLETGSAIHTCSTGDGSHSTGEKEDGKSTGVVLQSSGIQ